MENQGKTVLEFKIDGRPPRKSGAKSCWASDEAHYVLELRKKAFEAKSKINMTESFTTPVKIELMIYSPNITDRNNAQTYLGDIDTFIAGVCEALQPAPPQVEPNIIFQKNDDVHPSKPIVLNDDSQVVQIIAKKIKDEQKFYTLLIESI